MKRLTKEEFEMLRESRKFSRKKCEDIALENKIKNGEFIDPKNIKK